MTTAENFTELAEGSDVALAGHVARCPHCGRNGIEQRVEGAVSYLHVQTSEMFGDGLLVQPEDFCRLDPSRP